MDIKCLLRHFCQAQGSKTRFPQDLLRSDRVALGCNFFIDKITTKYIFSSMNQKTVISVKLDKDVKESAQGVAKSAGLTLSALVNAYLRQIASTRRIELFAPEEMTPKLEGLIADVEAELKTGNLSPAFENADDFIADLKK